MAPQYPVLSNMIVSVGFQSTNIYECHSIGAAKIGLVFQSILTRWSFNIDLTGPMFHVPARNIFLLISAFN